MKIITARCAQLATVTLATLACGCTSMNSAPSAQNGAIVQATTAMPRVENCAVVNIGSPSKFACNEKVYTTFELAKLREQAEKKGASGK